MSSDQAPIAPTNAPPAATVASTPSQSIDRPWMYPLDGVRACAMLLVIAAHAAMPFTTRCPPFWFREDLRSRAFDIFVVLVQMVTMPAFLLMSGYLARMSYYRSGARAFVRGRLKHIVLPFFVAWAVMACASYFLMNYPPDYPQKNKLFIALTGTFHLWYIWFLILFLTAAIVWHEGPGRAVSEATKARLDRAVEMMLRTALAPILCGLLTLPSMLFVRAWFMEVDQSFFPRARVLSYYFVFFVFGWLMQRRPQRLNDIERHCETWVIASVVGVALLALGGWPLFHLPLALVGRPFQSFLAWTLTFAVLAVFLRYFNRPIAFIGYLRDFGYFAYLAHLPIMLLFMMELHDMEIFGLPKLFLVLFLTIATLLMLFQVLIRPYAIGKILGVRGTKTAPSSTSLTPAQVPAT